MTPTELALREALSALTWDNEGKYIYFTQKCDFARNQLLNGVIEFIGDKDLPLISIAHLQKIVNSLGDLNLQSIALIDKNHPENDEKLTLSDLTIYSDGRFALGYNCGDSPAGDLVIYVEYDTNLVQNAELIYETY